MTTNLSIRTPRSMTCRLGLILLLFTAGCVAKSSPDVANLICANNQGCPAGYECRIPNVRGGCCAPGKACAAGNDAGSPDVYPVDLKVTTDAPPDNQNSDANSTQPGDGPIGKDQAAGGAGGAADAPASGGAGGSSATSSGGAGGSSATSSGGAGGSGGPSSGGAGGSGATSSGGAGGSGGPSSGGAGGSGGTSSTVPNLDGSAPDRVSPVPDGPEVAVPDAPPVDTQPPVDAPGTCSLDKDCSSQNPLCLGNRCAKCAKDSDCTGRAGPACAASGLCVACTTNAYCTGAAATCDTATNQCVGCVNRSDCAGTCQTCTGNVCTAVKGKDDPGVCDGTCDSTGACKKKQGQACQTAADCVGGIPCADGLCCDKTCTGSCQACDVAGSLGTCTTLALNATPHAGHPACVASDATCAGKCSGTSAACSYPASTTTCGTASCTGKSFQAMGTCSSGTCTMPAAQTCPNVCVLSAGGCKDCTPNTKQCSSGGIPQLCSSGGTWQNQTACATGTSCLAGDCKCSQTTCGGACVDTGSDPKNCGSCGHDCLGGTCSGGQCQPSAVVSNTGDNVRAFAIDSTYVYYQAQDSTGFVNAYRIDKRTVNGSNSPPLYVGTYSNNFPGVIGSTLFSSDRGGCGMCNIGSCSTLGATPGTGDIIPFKNPAPRYFAQYDDLVNRTSFTWYSTTKVSEAHYSEIPPYTASSWEYPSYFAFGDVVYWIRTLFDAGYNPTDVSLYSVGVSNTTQSSHLAGSMTPLAGVVIVDVNAQSVLLDSGTGELLRVPLPGGKGGAAPDVLVTLSATPATLEGAVEDATGVYWIEGDGTMYQCSAANCTTSKKNLALGLNCNGYLFLDQDTSALYWGDIGTHQVMRLVK